MIAYLDMVSAQQPPYGDGPWRAHAVRIALAIEQDRQIISTIVRRVLTPPETAIDPGWCARYGVTAAGVEDAQPVVQVGVEVAGELASATLAAGAPLIMCAHFERFHRRVLVGLMTDAAQPYPDATWFCTMRQSMDACRLPMRNGRGFKSPNFGEAVAHFTGEQPRPIAGLTWQQVALQQLTGLRRIYWGINRWGLAPEVTGEAVGA